MPITFKGPSNSGSDIDKAVRKLKSLYRKYADQYGQKLFSLQGFETRYRNALINKTNLNSFLHAEILAFEELKNRIGRRQEIKTEVPSTHESSYSEIADRIIEQNLEQVRRYQCIDFHPDAEEETKYLLGAATGFYYSTWNKIAKLFKPIGIRKLNDFVQKIENDFSYYIVPVGGQYSRAVDDYLIVLSRKDTDDNERAAVKFIKYGAILLNNCLKLVGDGLNFMIGKQEYSPQYAELQGYKNILSPIIEDFRLSDIRNY